MAPCDTQEEIDYFWGKLSADPRAEQCGWLKDKYGVSWQIAPVILQEMLSSGDKALAGRVTQAFLRMKKFDMDELKRAATGSDS
jgi:predicted 3-demethylubiquinone-9 3-methyltransferase (glyoxalase superfamily)